MRLLTGRVLCLLPLLVSVGCIADVQLDLDGDADGLIDSQEAEVGSDPGKADSDDDGYTDGAEYTGNTSPIDADDKPYQAGWQIDACRHDIVSTGAEEGDIAADFALPDQFGETVHLHDFCDQVVLVMGAGFT
ncbi:MAG: hypothetical protein Q8P18_12100 [Pseudomonadota bacterium]|nr:hypothetical protein [Pseudomonadota bacterium]